MPTAEELRVVIKAEVAKAQRDLKNFQRTSRRTGGAVAEMGKKLKSVFAGAAVIGGAVAVGKAIYGAGQASLKFAADIEQTTISFKVLLGSMEAAESHFANIQQFAASTPFQLPELASASKRLLAFGTSAEDVIEKMRNLGNASMGNSEVLGRLVDAYGKVQAKGRATLEELNRFTEAGVPILKQLQEQYGVTKEEMFSLIETGKVGFQDVDRALTDLTTGQGQFAGMMEEQSQTLNGLMSTLRDNVQMLGAEMVEDLIPAVKSAVSWFTEMVKTVRERREESEAFGAAAEKILAGESASLAEIELAYQHATQQAEKYNAQVEKMEGNFFQRGGEGQKIAEMWAGYYGDMAEKLSRQMVAQQQLTELAKTRKQEEAEIAAAIDEQAKQAAEMAAQRAAEAAAQQERIEQSYKDAYKIVLRTLEGEKSELEKLQEQYDELADHPWAKGSDLEKQRLEAMAALKRQMADLNKEEEKQVETSTLALDIANDLAKAEREYQERIAARLEEQEKDKTAEKLEEEKKKLEEAKNAVTALGEEYSELAMTITRELGQSFEDIDFSAIGRQIGAIGGPVGEYIGQFVGDFVNQAKQAIMHDDVAAGEIAQSLTDVWKRAAAAGDWEQFQQALSSRLIDAILQSGMEIMRVEQDIKKLAKQVQRAYRDGVLDEAEKAKIQATRDAIQGKMDVATNVVNQLRSDMPDIFPTPETSAQAGSDNGGGRGGSRNIVPFPYRTAGAAGSAPVNNYYNVNVAGSVTTEENLARNVTRIQQRQGFG